MWLVAVHRCCAVCCFMTSMEHLMKCCLYVLTCCVLACFVLDSAAATNTHFDHPLISRDGADEPMQDLLQQFRVDLEREYLNEYIREKRRAHEGYNVEVPSLISTQDGVDVSATDMFRYNDTDYVIVSRTTLGDSYIASIGLDDSGSLVEERLASFSLDSFIDSEYNATFQQTLEDRVVEIKSHVFGGQVFIMAALQGGPTLLFLVKSPWHSWTPKYQDSVLSGDEVAGDFAFFHDKQQRLCVFVAVARRYLDGEMVTAHQSYIYRLSGGVKWLQTHAVPTHLGATAVTTFTSEHKIYIIVGQQLGHSLVYRYGSDSLELFQYLSARGVVTVQAFHHYQQLYLLLATDSSEALLFWWTAEQLVLWQQLQLPEGATEQSQLVTRAVAFPDQTSFIYIAQGTLVTFYTTFGSYSGHFSAALTHRLLGGARLQHIRVTTVHSVAAGLVFYLQAAVGSPPAAISWLLYRLPVNSSPVEPERVAVDPLLSCMEHLHNAVESLLYQVNALKREAADLFTITTSSGDVNGTITVTDDVIIDGPVNIAELYIRSDTTDVIHLDEIEELVDESDETVQRITDSLQSALTLSTQQNITGSYHFQRLTVSERLEVEDAVRLDLLWTQSLSELFNDTLTYTDKQEIEGKFIFTTGDVDDLTFEKGAFLNNLLAEDLMYTSGDQVVSGQHEYLQLSVTGDVIGVTRLNEVALSSVLRAGQTLTVPSAQLQQVDILHLNVTKLNQIDFEAWLADTIQLNVVNTFSTPVQMLSAQFSSVVVTEVNGHELDSFVSGLWNSSGETPLTGVDFAVAPSVDDLLVLSVNGVNLLEDVLTSDSEQIISTPLLVDIVTDLSGESSAETVNGLSLPGHTLSVTGSTSLVQGTVTFTESALVRGDVIVYNNATLNGLHVRHIPTTLSNAGHLHFSAPLVINGSLLLSHADVNISHINGVNVNQLHQQYWTTDRDQVITTTASVPSLAASGDIYLTSINDIPSGSLLDINSAGTVHSDIVFTGTVSVAEFNLTEDILINDEDLSSLANSVVTSNSFQQISGNKVFAGDVAVDSIHAASINGLSTPDDLLLSTADQTQTGGLVFSAGTLLLSNLVAMNDVEVTGTLNGYSQEEILDRLIGGGTGSNIQNHTLVIQGAAHFHDLHILETLNGADYDQLLDGLLLVDQDRNITGDFVIDGDVSFLGNVSLNSANGVDWSRYLSKLVRSDVGGTVAGTTLLDGSSLLLEPGSGSQLTVDSLNQLTADSIYSQYLTTDTDQLISQRLYINGTLVADSVDIDTINGVPVDSMAFIDKDINFQNDLYILANASFNELFIDNAVAGACNFSQIWESGVRRNGSQLLSGSLFVEKMHVTGQLKSTNGQINPLPPHRVVTVSNNLTITGGVVFEKQLVVNSATVDLFNGYNVPEFFEDALTVNDQSVVFSSGVEFSSTVSVLGGLTVQTRLDTPGLVNQLVFDDWLQSLLLLSAEDIQLSGPLIHANLTVGNLLLIGTLNGNDVQQYRLKNESVNTDVIFAGNITVLNGVDVEGTVDGVDLDALLDSAVQTDLTDLHADVFFSGSVYFLSDVNVTVVNGVPISELVYTGVDSTHQQIITGHKRFRSLTIQGAVCGRLNGIQVPQLCSSLISSSPLSTQTLYGHLELSSESVGVDMPERDKLAILEGLTAATRTEKLRVRAWMERVHSSIGQLTERVHQLRAHTDYRMDLAYLLLVDQVPLDGVVQVQTGTAVHVTSTSESNCALPRGCQCRSYSVYQVDDDGGMVKTSQSQPGQSWQFPIPELNILITVVTASSSYSNRCQTVETPTLTVASSPLDGSVLGSNQTAAAVVHDVDSVLDAYVSDAHLYRHDGSLYLVLSYSFSTSGVAGTTLYRLDDAVWTLIQTVSTVSTFSVQVSIADPLPLLLTINRDSAVFGSSGSQVQVWRWNDINQQFESVDTLQLTEVRSAVFLPVGSKTLLLIAHLDGISVFEYSEEVGGYSLCQYLSRGGVTSLRTFTLTGQLFLAAHSSRHNEITVYVFAPQNGLVRFAGYPAASVRHMDVLRMRDGRLYLVVASRQGVLLYRAVTRGRTPIELPSIGDN